MPLGSSVTVVKVLWKNKIYVQKARKVHVQNSEEKVTCVWWERVDRARGVCLMGFCQSNRSTGFLICRVLADRLQYKKTSFRVRTDRLGRQKATLLGTSRQIAVDGSLFWLVWEVGLCDYSFILIYNLI